MTISIDLDEKQIKDTKKKSKSFFRKTVKGNSPLRKRPSPLHLKQTPSSTEQLPQREGKKIEERRKKSISTKKKFNWKKIVLYSFLTLLTSALIYGGFRVYKVAKKIGFKLNPNNLITKETSPELKKDSAGKHTNALLVGIDTRENESSLLNTDSIIFASFDYDTKDITLISIPRDFYVSLPDEFWFKKINSFYTYGESLEEGSGLSLLQTKVEELINEEIQYYAMIDLKGFTDLIDSLDGVYINVENSFTDYMYPIDGSTNYQTVTFSAGPQTMDGDTALKYARSRHSIDNGEGSDFARARRQQKVIAAIKDDLFNSGNFTKPQLILDLINTISNNLTISEFTIDDIKAVLKIQEGFQDGEGEVFSFVLDPNIGNSRIVTSKNVTTTNAYAIGPVLGLGQYEDIHDFINKVLADPKFYEEDASIYVYDTGLGYQSTYIKTQELLEEYPYSNIRFMGSLFYDKEGVVIYEHEAGLKSSTINKLATFLDTINLTQPEYITTNLNGEDISIFFGKPIVVEEVNTDE